MFGYRLAGCSVLSGMAACVLLALVLQLALVAPVLAGKKQAGAPVLQSMRFAIVRSAVPSCEPACPEWIWASGTILDDTPAKLRKILKVMGKRRLPIIMESNGGNVDAAMQVGRMIRKRGLDIAIGRTRFEGCSPDQKCKPDRYADGAYAGFPYPAGAYCLSACPYIFAAGEKRLVGPWALIGVHQITQVYTQTRITYETRYRMVNGKKKILDTKIVGRKPAGSYERTDLSKGYRQKLLAYFTGMGIDPAIVDRMLSIPAKDISVLTQDELVAFKLVSGTGDVSDLAATRICEQEPKAANCVELKSAGSKIVSRMD
ncbi:COG3904 family protein [Phyllobacterium calauticae]|jgi:hypothetical protein|uniref:COG3904 family protein n=1 Tax=Phyllobacterium calauticae TaxID=2817027 RepID=UPI001CBE6DBD|nr:hypothetical protein [Phyllobacterium calauticae]MBZ3693081.1 hypothetical protein [Phyllobacterium calauticae]